MDLRSVRITHRTKEVKYVEPQGYHAVRALIFREHSTWDVGIFGDSDIIKPTERFPEVWHVFLEGPCTKGLQLNSKL